MIIISTFSWRYENFFFASEFIGFFSFIKFSIVFESYSPFESRMMEKVSSERVLSFISLSQVNKYRMPKFLHTIIIKEHFSKNFTYFWCENLLFCQSFDARWKSGFQTTPLAINWYLQWWTLIWCFVHPPEPFYVLSSVLITRQKKRNTEQSGEKTHNDTANVKASQWYFS